ncbi:integrase [Enterococcus faecium]|jgi:IS30 family transposase|nr:integrase [Enterococcus faecium]OTO90289.1 integrase [Enterococcus faecium]
MTYTHLTTDELVIIESYFKINQSVAKTAYCLNRSRQTIHKVYLFFKQGKSSLEYYQQYKKNKSNCGRHPLVLPEEQSEYIQRKVGHPM